MQAEWEPDELIGAWTLAKGDWDLIANKAGVTRLGFAVMLKFYEIEGRFPAYREEVPQAAVDYLGVAGEGRARAVRQVFLAGPDDRVPQGADPQGVRDPAADGGR